MQDGPQPTCDHKVVRCGMSSREWKIGMVLALKIIDVGLL